MGYVLYGWPQTGSMAIEAALGEAGVAHAFVPVSRKTDANKEPEFTAINPRQQLPALVLPEGTIVTEGPAILSHIADAHPEAGLIPPPGSPARAIHDRWTAFFHANVYEAMLRELRPASYTIGGVGLEEIREAAIQYTRRHFQLFETQLASGPYLLGGRLQMFDIYLWMLCHWVDPDWLTATCPRIRKLQLTASARPALAAVARRHFG